MRSVFAGWALQANMQSSAQARPNPVRPVPSAIDSLCRVAGGLRSRVSRDLLAYWHMLCDKAEGNLPTRAMVDPAAIGPRLLPHIFLCEYLDDGDVLIRLQGSYLAARAYQTLTNQRIGSGFFGASAPAILAVYDAVRLHRCPIATHETRRHEGILIKAEVMHCSAP